ncbi:MAG: hypothetical protein LQ352_000141 [Teloschistes flavicans]|nr:MAG: hypothetical protein LQ352_000141 [Teloschistes flavicans]
MNFTVTSKGRQFDRLGLMYLGDIEVFRTSTAEPTTNGITWTYIKEMEQYKALWKTDQKIIFDLGNLIDDTYTGIFSTTLTATFFTVPNARPTADQILPISAEASGRDAPSAFSLPSDTALVNHQIPQNVERAVVSLSACGQATEEFWYTNVFSSEVNTFGDEVGTLYGYSPFREVQLLIDGQLTGVSWPFPIIFTGGIVPGLWRPIAGIDAFDLREHEIDITPWLPVLCDGASHSFEIRVAGINDDGHGDASLSETVGSTWIVTGKIFLFLGPEGSITFGTPPKVNVSPPSLETTSSITTNSTGANETLTYSTSASRSISITSEIKTKNGSSFSASWVQSLTYTNLNVLSSQGFVQYTKQSTTGSDSSSSRYRNDYSYPLTVNSTVSVSDNGDFGIDASLTRGLDFAVSGPAVFPSKVQPFNHTAFSPAALFTLSGRQQPVSLSTSPLPFFSGAWTTTTQTGEAHYLSAGNRSYSFGTTSQHFIFTGLEGTIDAGTNLELYKRDVKAVNATVVSDVEVLVGRRVNPSPLLGAATGLVAQQDVGAGSVRELLGRGPGRRKDVLVMAGGHTEQTTA